VSLLTAVSREAPFRSVLCAALKVAYKLTPSAFRWAAYFDAIPYVHYAVGLARAAEFAALFGIRSFSAIELGVAGGNGLMWLSKHARSVSTQTGMTIRVAGFDNATGLPPIADWRDAPWVYSPGEYPCDVDALTKRLGRSELVLGDIAETLPEWLAQGHAPVGFLAVDVDYYSSAIAGLKALGSAAPQALLPICESYFDDILCRGMPRFAGEFAAIAEFNKSNSHRQFDRDDSLGEWRPFSERLWLKRMYSFYCLDHPSMQTHRQRQPRRLDLVDAS